MSIIVILNMSSRPTLTIDAATACQSDYDGKRCYVHVVSRPPEWFRIAEVQLHQNETATTEVKTDFVPEEGDRVFFAVEVLVDVIDPTQYEIRVRNGYRHLLDAVNHIVVVPRRIRLYVDVYQYIWMSFVGKTEPV